MIKSAVRYCWHLRIQNASPSECNGCCSTRRWSHSCGYPLRTRKRQRWDCGSTTSDDDLGNLRLRRNRAFRTYSYSTSGAIYMSQNVIVVVMDTVRAGDLDLPTDRRELLSTISEPSTVFRQTVTPPLGPSCPMRLSSLERPHQNTAHMQLTNTLTTP